MAKLSIVTWNIDGLSGVNVSIRAKEVVSTLLRRNPDVILLQECVNENENIFTKSFTANGYTKCGGGQIEFVVPYFTLAYAKVSKSLTINKPWTKYDGT